MEFRTTSDCKYSCDTATQTLHWINAIIHFLKPFTFFMHAHVVNFFKVLLFPIPPTKYFPSHFLASQTYKQTKPISIYIYFLLMLMLLLWQDRLWESVDKEWMDCLRNEPVENLLLIPSGVVQVLHSFLIEISLIYTFTLQVWVFFMWVPKVLRILISFSKEKV